MNPAPMPICRFTLPRPHDFRGQASLGQVVNGWALIDWKKSNVTPHLAHEYS